MCDDLQKNGVDALFQQEQSKTVMKQKLLENDNLMMKERLDEQKVEAENDRQDLQQKYFEMMTQNDTQKTQLQSKVLETEIRALEAEKKLECN